MPLESLNSWRNKDRSTYVILPLEKAVYCQNCTMITNTVGEVCYHCHTVGGLLLMEKIIPPVESGVVRHAEGT